MLRWRIEKIFYARPAETTREVEIVVWDDEDETHPGFLIQRAVAIPASIDSIEAIEREAFAELMRVYAELSARLPTAIKFEGPPAQ